MMIFELRRCRGAAGDESGEASAEKMFRDETWRAELIRQAWQFELSGEAGRRGLS